MKMGLAPRCVALVCFAAVSAGCKGSAGKADFAAAKKKCGAAISTIESHAAFLKVADESDDIDLAIADAARARIFERTRPFASKPSGSVDTDRLLRDPSYRLAELLGSFDTFCAAPFKLSSMEEPKRRDRLDRLKSCADAVRFVDETITSLGAQAKAAGAGDDFPAEPSKWIDAVDATAAKELEDLRSKLPGGAIAKVWADPGATLQTFDEACGKELEKKDALTPKVTSDLEELVRDAQVTMVKRCATILQLRLAEKMGGRADPMSKPKCDELPVAFKGRPCKSY